MALCGHARSSDRETKHGYLRLLKMPQGSLARFGSWQHRFRRAHCSARCLREPCRQRPAVSMCQEMATSRAILAHGICARVHSKDIRTRSRSTPASVLFQAAWEHQMACGQGGVDVVATAIRLQLHRRKDGHGDRANEDGHVDKTGGGGASRARGCSAESAR